MAGSFCDSCRTHPILQYKSDVARRQLDNVPVDWHIDRMSEDVTLSIAELAERAAVSRRTVRYYIELGLVPAPLGRGRGEHYDGRHLAAVLRVKTLQQEGLSLDEIRERRSQRDRRGRPRDGAERRAAADRRAGDDRRGAAGRGPWAPPPGTAAWVRQQVAPGVELHLQGARPLSEAQLSALARFLNELVIREEMTA